MDVLSRHQTLEFASTPTAFREASTSGLRTARGPAINILAQLLRSGLPGSCITHHQTDIETAIAIDGKFNGNFKRLNCVV